MEVRHVLDTYLGTYSLDAHTVPSTWGYDMDKAAVDRERQLLAQHAQDEEVVGAVLVVHHGGAADQLVPAEDETGDDVREREVRVLRPDEVVRAVEPNHLAHAIGVVHIVECVRDRAGQRCARRDRHPLWSRYEAEVGHDGRGYDDALHAG